MLLFLFRNLFSFLMVLQLLMNAQNLSACTGIKLIAKDGFSVHGRTLEFGLKIDSSIVVIPRGYAFKGTTPEGLGLEYKSKYGVVGFIAFDEPAVLDGMNEKGLSVGVFYFPGFAEYAKISKENQQKALSPIEFSNWILTQFSNLDEVRAALADIVIAPTIVKDWGNEPPPFHYIIYDKSGNSLVIEPIKGKLISYENPLGVFTNSPTFDWHMTNLRNFINLSPFNAKPLQVEGIELAPFGQGSGMVGMPGDFTPPSRFVRAAIYSITATPSQNNKEAVYQAFHILNQFDIPVGVVQAKDKDIIHTDYTLITCVRNPQDLKIYFKTFEDQTIRFVDLKKFDLQVKEIKKLNTSKYSQPSMDISEALKS